MKKNQLIVLNLNKLDNKQANQSKHFIIFDYELEQQI